MGKKSEAREARQKERFARFEQAKERILARVSEDEGPRLERLPDSEKFRISLGVDPRTLSIPTQPRAAKSGDSILNEVVSLCTRRGDVVGYWSWGDARQWTEPEWENDIHPKFAEFERLLWREVQAQSSESGHRMHHFQELHSLNREAQERWLDLGLEEFDTLFRFRLGATKRFWGFLIGNHFFGVWWDPRHRIYPVD